MWTVWELVLGFTNKIDRFVGGVRCSFGYDRSALARAGQSSGISLLYLLEGRTRTWTRTWTRSFTARLF